MLCGLLMVLLFCDWLLAQVKKSLYNNNDDILVDM